jgi:hypothetical protein
VSDLELYLAVGTGVVAAIAAAAGYAYKKRAERPKRPSSGV